MSRYLWYEPLPDYAVYEDLYEGYERIVTRDKALMDDALDRITSVRQQSLRDARTRIARYTVNLQSALPTAAELTQHRSFIVGFSQGVSVGKLLFKSDEFTEHSIAQSMEQLIAQTHETCHQYHPEELPDDTNVAHFSHSLAHLGEAGADVIGSKACQTIHNWSEQVYQKSARDKTAYVLGHLVTALAVSQHQAAINRFVRPLSASREAS